jgi:hypothetical protein
MLGPRRGPRICLKAGSAEKPGSDPRSGTGGVCFVKPVLSTALYRKYKAMLSRVRRSFESV